MTLSFSRRWCPQKRTVIAERYFGILFVEKKGIGGFPVAVYDTDRHKKLYAYRELDQ